ncbi:head-tail connector protein [Leuconostoc mesenteroides]|uniref:head-tail connector protein n=1 Tax=Leuconostoc mesenteroides TaxID=1245 RepID=UPI0021A68A3E|nr:head-tail connector protein [Leuconostoc mesenteroides]MCT3053649.1 phage gp6-like head-tail connector protein [Leuconostoc mesenteroides]
MNSDEILPLLKSSLRIAGDEDNEMLKLIIDASIDNVKSMVGTKDEFFKENKSFKLAVLQQSTNNFLNRASSSDVDLFDTKYGMQSAVLHLKAQYQIWEANNGETE